MMIMGEDIENYVHAAYLQEKGTTTQTVHRFRRNADMLPGPTADSDTSDDFIRTLEFQNISLRQRKRILEQLLLLSVIVGRWLMPRDGLTRDQLSQLLLINIGTAADILELFEAFEEAIVRQDDFLRVIILSLWQASLLQFCFNKTALKEPKIKRTCSRQEEILVSTRLLNEAQTINNRGNDPNGSDPNQSMEIPDVKKDNRSYLKRWLFRKDSSSQDYLNNIEHGLNGCQIDSQQTTIQPNASGSGISTNWPLFGGCIFLCRERPCLCCETELWAIGLSLMLQDLPFLILRVTLIMYYNVKSYSNVFFTCKNTLLILLQVFRSIVIIIESCPRPNDVQRDIGNL